MLFSHTIISDQLPTTDLEKNTQSSPSRYSRHAILITIIITAICFTLVVLSFAILFAFLPVLYSTSSATSMPIVSRPESPLDTDAAHPSARPHIELSPSQELAAITAFVTSYASNAIPPSVNPSAPVDPQLILEFDIHKLGAATELDALEEELWTRHPVVLYGKAHSPISRLVKSTLSSLELTPSPVFIDVDLREDASILTPIITRLTDSTQLPVLLIGGKVVSYDDSTSLIEQMRFLQTSGEFDRMLTDAGVVISGRQAVVKKQRVQANPREALKRPQKRELSYEEKVFRGLITL